MRKQVTAQQAYKACFTKNGNPRKVSQPAPIINGCPDCGGTGKLNKHTCPTCGGEKDN
jgi:DnaJ-class molecular chaperone